jgi:predicted nucleic acid-binding protein
VLSQRIKSRPDGRVAAWLNNAIAGDVFLSVVTILEIRTGIELMAVGTKRTKLEAWLEGDVRRCYSGRILPVTEEIASVGGRLIAERRKASETPGSNDCLLAATALVHGLNVATLNRKHFEKLGVELVEF